VEVAVPGVELHFEPDPQQREADHRGEQDQPRAALLRHPVGLGQRPQGREESFLLHGVTSGDGALSRGQFTERPRQGQNGCMQQVYRFGPAPKQPARHLFVFLHASGADARSMIPAAFKYQARFPSAALVVPSGFSLYQKTPESKQWFSTSGLTDENRMARISAILPRIEQLVRRE